MRNLRTSKDDQFARIAPYYDAIMMNVPYDLWAEYVNQLAILAGQPIHQGVNLLDLATGTGSLAMQFAARGCEVTGVDLSAPMIAEAERKANQSNLAISFLCCDLAELSLDSEFTHAICLYDSLNYIIQPEKLEQAFANIANALISDAIFIFDVNTMHALEAELFTQESPPDSLIPYQWKSKYNPRTRISTVKMRFFIKDGSDINIVHKQRAYTDAELRSMLYRAGFEDINSYDAYRYLRPGPQSDRVFYVAKRSQPTH